LGLGSPLLVSNTPVTISTGGFKDKNKRWNKKTTWSSQAVSEMASLRVKDIFAKLGTDESDTVIKLFHELCLHIMSRSSPIMLSNLECRVTLARQEIQAMHEDRDEDGDSSDDDSSVETLGAGDIDRGHSGGADEEEDDEFSDVEFCDAEI
jgi:hypothetical protein